MNFNILKNKRKKEIIPYIIKNNSKIVYTDNDIENIESNFKQSVTPVKSIGGGMYIFKNKFYDKNNKLIVFNENALENV
jgi:hypothetical protein